MNQYCHNLTGVKTVKHKLFSEFRIIGGIRNLYIVYPVLVYSPDKVIQDIGDPVKLMVIHMTLIIQNGFLRHQFYLFVYFAYGYFSLKMILNPIETGSNQPVKHIGNQITVFQNHIYAGSLFLFHKYLGFKTRTFGGQTQTHKMHTQLVLRVILQQFVCHGRLTFGTAAGFCIHIQQMPVGYDMGQVHCLHIRHFPFGNLQSCK